MTTRILAALLVAPPFLWCVHAGGAPLAAVMALLAMLAIRELHSLQDVPPPDPVETLLAGGVAAAGALGDSALLGALGLAAARLALPLAFPPIEAERVRRCLVSLGGLLLYVLPFGLFQVLRGGPQGLALAAALLALVWGQDSAAYFTGRAFGRTSLSPEVSPRKTWEGTLGGFLVGVGLSLGVFQAMGGTWGGVGVPGVWAGALLLAAAAGAAQLGDLVESGIKRASGVKDSGTLLPGHGGVLDRFDGFALAILVLAGALPLLRVLAG